MMGELFSYLVRQAESFELEGIKSKAGHLVDDFFYRLNSEKDRMIEPVMKEFFDKMEALKQRFLRQLARLFVFASGFFLVSLGAGFAIDEIINFSGAGHIIVGLVLITASYLMIKE